MSILIIINFKSYGGFYIDYIKNWSIRISLGWMAITIWEKDVESILEMQMNREIEYEINLEKDHKSRKTA